MGIIVSHTAVFSNRLVTFGHYGFPFWEDDDDDDASKRKDDNHDDEYKSMLAHRSKAAATNARTSQLEDFFLGNNCICAPE